MDRISSLGELVDKMVRLYTNNKESIDNRDDSNEAYREYAKCMRILDEYEYRVDGGLRPGFFS